MAVYPPTPRLAENDKRILALLGRLLLERFDKDGALSNLPEGAVILSDGEAIELMGRLKQLAGSREFIEGSYFVEAMTQKEERYSDRVRRLYISARKRNGRSDLLASRKWFEFQIRLGSANQDVIDRSLKPMDFDQFIKMEMELLKAAGIDQRIIDLTSKLVYARQSEVAQALSGSKRLEHGAVKRAVLEPILRWDRRIQEGILSVNRLSAAITVVADLSVLFTTRDWGVAGTMSTIAGAMIAASSD